MHMVMYKMDPEIGLDFCPPLTTLHQSSNYVPHIQERDPLVMVLLEGMVCGVGWGGG